MQYIKTTNSVHFQHENLKPTNLKSGPISIVFQDFENQFSFLDSILYKNLSF